MVQKNNSPLKNIFYVGSIGGISLFTGLCAAYYQSPEVPIIADPEVEKDVVLAQEFTLMSQKNFILNFTKVMIFFLRNLFCKIVIEHILIIIVKSSRISLL